ncbi:MAG: ferritin-like domain-containing protein [Gemmatimonadota bacterium]
MSDTNRPGEQGPSLVPLDQPTGRRDFLRWTGAGAAAVFVAAACDDTEVRTITEVTRPDTVVVNPPPPTFAAVTLNFTNDFGVLNFAFALEQLEAAFYTQVVATPYSGITDAERRVLTDLRDHEVIHRDFLRAALGTNAIGSLTPNFSAVNFSSRDSVLTTARMFEDLGVAAYNGAGQFLTSPALLTVAGKIVSVEARHASAIRDLLNPRSRDFAPRAFDDAFPPQQVIAAAAPFIRNTVTLTNVPNFTPSADLA